MNKREKHTCLCCAREFKTYWSALAHARKFHQSYHREHGLRDTRIVHHSKFVKQVMCECCPDGVLRPANKPLESKGVVLGVVSMPVNQTNSIQSNQNDVEVTEEKGTVRHSNPVLNLNIMQLTKESFANCRTQDGYICIYDAIASFRGCSIQEASVQYFRIRELLPTNANDMRKIQFPRSDGRMGKAVPCCTFQTLLGKVLPNIPGHRARTLAMHLADRAIDSVIAIQAVTSTGECTFNANDSSITVNARSVVSNNSENAFRTSKNTWKCMISQPTLDDMISVKLPDEDVVTRGYIYFARIGKSENVKVGTTTCLINRLHTLQTAVPTGDLHYIHTVFVDGRFEIESKLHNIMTSDGCRIRVNGEWFKLSQNQVNYYINVLHKLVGFQ